MRTRFKESILHPTRWYEYWLDTPWKYKRNWHTLLREPGRGWLTWATGEFEYVEPVPGFYGQGPSFTATCAPPLRRVWISRHCHCFRHCYNSLKDPDWIEGYLVYRKYKR